jgi:hypothetical protein
MVLHLSHDEGGYGVTVNDVTKDAVFYDYYITLRDLVWAFSQERYWLWLSKPQRTIFGTHPHRLMLELVVDCVPRMMSLNSRGLLPSHFLNLTSSLRFLS